MEPHMSSVLCCILLYVIFIIAVSSVNLLYKSEQLSFCDKQRGDGNTLLLTLSGVRSSMDCGVLCTNDRLCLSADYEKEEELCHLYSTGHRYFDSKCDCLRKDDNAAFIYKDHPCYFKMPTDTNGKCICDDGFSGDHCENPPRDCNDFNVTKQKIGEIYLEPERCHGFLTACSFNKLIVFKNSAGHQTKQTWDDLKVLFFSRVEFWWGTEQMHRITNQMYNYSLYLSVHRGSGIVNSRVYTNFHLDDETNNYAFRYSRTCSFDDPLNSTADNILSDGAEFHSFDHNDEEGCTTIHKAAFWYQIDCRYPSPLLGQYSFEGQMENITKIQASIIRQVGDNVTILFAQTTRTWIASSCLPL